MQMKSLTYKRNRHNKRRGNNLLELLLALSILTGALYPIVYIFKLAKPETQKTQTEFLATLLSHHVLETIIAKKQKDPEYLPEMTEPEPVAREKNSSDKVSDYFMNILPKNEGITKEAYPQIYWPTKIYKSQVDTYYIEGSLYKVISYISYMSEGREMKVFLERLLAQASPQTINNMDEEPRNE
jgi:hypothetical protein